MQTKKRKRDSDYPRITYHSEGRTFDRLFKEESLWETKEVVRQKLGLGSGAVIQLVQLREGLTVDLEDDDDFDAFYALSRTTPALDVRVTVMDDQIEGGRNTPDRIRPGQLLVNEMQRGQSSFAESTPVQYFHDEDPSHSTPGSASNRKRKVSFVDSPDIPQANGQTKRRKSISRGVATSDLPNPPKPPTIPSAGVSGDTSGPNMSDSDSDNHMEDVLMSAGESSVRTEKITSKSKRESQTLEGQQDITGDGLPSHSGAYTMPDADLPMTPSDEDEQRILVKTPAKKRPHLSRVVPLHKVTTLSSSSSIHVGGPPFDSGTATKTKQRSNTTCTGQSKRKRGKDQEEQASVSSVTTPPSDHPVAQNDIQQSGPAHPESGGDVGQKAPDAHGEISRDMSEANAGAVGLTKKKKSNIKTTTDEGSRTAKSSHCDVLVANSQGPQSNSMAPELDGNVAHDDIEAESTGRSERPKQSGQPRLEMSGDPEGIYGPTGNASKTSKPVQTRRKKSNDVACPVCLKTPLHLRYQCPIITAGLGSITKRLLELKENPSVYQVQLVEELEHMIKEGKMKKVKKSNLNAESSTIYSLRQQALFKESPSDKRSDAPLAEPANSESSVLPPADLAPRLPSRAPRDSRISNFTVDIQSEVSGSEGSSSSSESDEEGAHSPKVPKGPATVIPNPSSYTGMDLHTIIHGPPSLRPSDIANILVRETDDEEEVEEVILEEEDDAKPRRLSKKWQGVALSSDEEITVGEPDDDDEDIVFPPLAQARSTRSGDSSPPEAYTSFQAIDGSGESTETDRRGDIAFSDALATDKAALMLAEGSEDDTRVAPSADDGDETDVLVEKALSTQQQKNVTSEPVSERDRAHTSPTVESRIATFTNESAPQRDGDLVEIVAVTVVADNEPTPARQCSDTIVTSSKTHDQDPQEDPIEPADELLEEPRQSDINAANNKRARSQTPALTTTKGGRLKSMKDKSGKALQPEADVPVLTTKVAAGKVAETSADQESGGPDHTKKTRAATASALASSTPRPPVRAATPAKRGRPAKTAEQKALEAAEKIAAKEEKARLKLEKARMKEEEKAEKARLRRERAELATNKKVRARTPSLPAAPTSALAKKLSLAVPHTPPQTDPRPLVPPPSQPQWAALSQSPPAPDLDSSDQLQYSSPKRKEAAAPGGAKEKGKSRRDNSVEKDTEMQGDPLFMLTESQVPFPYSQYDTAAPDNQPPSQDADERPATSESEDETTNKKRKRPRMMSTSSYRKLTDIASQQGLFPASSLTPVDFPKQRTSDRALLGDSDEDEDEDEDTGDSGSDSGVDSGAERSHIPLARRAGANVIAI